MDQRGSRHIKLHCPRARWGQGQLIFAGPDPNPEGQDTSLALALGRVDPRSALTLAINSITAFKGISCGNNY